MNTGLEKMASKSPYNKAEEIKVRNDFRIVLKACLREGLFRTDADMDVISYRLMDLLCGRASTGMYLKKSYMKGYRAENMF